MKTAFITGAGGGIGAAIAKRLAADGCTPILHSHTKDCTAAAEELHGIAIRADLSDYAQIEAMVSSILKQVGHIDILVNNAGLSVTGLLTDIDHKTRRRLFDVNILAAIECSRLLLPSMVHRKSGCIVNISSMWGQAGASCEADYSATKAALIGFTKALAQEVAKRKITVNAVAPGFVRTDMVEGLDEVALAKQIPMQRFAEPEEVASVVAFLASKDASYITGECISINGGLYT